MDFELSAWILLLLFFPAVGIIGRRMEKKAWNGGFCPQTSQPWEYFDTDSQGGRGYKSVVNGKRYSVWISYPGIDK